VHVAHVPFCYYPDNYRIELIEKPSVAETR
jgi:hypothetical protein